MTLNYRFVGGNVLQGTAPESAYAVCIQRVVMHADATNGTWTNMPAAATFLFGSARHVQLVDVSGMTQFRLVVNKQTTAGGASSALVARYATSYSTTVGSYVDLGVTPGSVAANAQNTFLDSGWINLAAGAISAGNIYLAIIGSGGDGVLDPQFGSVVVMFR